MGIETHFVESEEMVSVEDIVRRWVKEWKASREKSVDELFQYIACMYEIYKKIKAGERPYLRKDYVNLFGTQIDRLHKVRLTAKIKARLPNVLEALQSAYLELRKYSDQVQGVHLQATVDDPAFSEVDRLYKILTTKPIFALCTTY